MQLKDFISTALIDICDGIAEAKSKIEEQVSPSRKTLGKIVHTEEHISFEVCVTVDNTDQLKNADGGGVKFNVLNVVSAEFGKNVSTDTKAITTNVHKIAFKVPYLPTLIQKAKK